jgi:thioredoxin reductase (NADPH)
MHKTDVVIIGAGPAGLFAVFQAGMLGMKSHVIDCLDELGGQCTALYPEKPIYDIPSRPKILASELIDDLVEQGSSFKPIYHLGNTVTSYKKLDDNIFIVKTDKGIEIETKIIVIATGSGAFGPNRPPLDEIEKYEGKSVFYYIKRPQDFTGKKIAIAGGGDSAIDWAIILSDYAEKIYLVHRRDKFRAAPASMDKINIIAKTGKIELVVPYQLQSIDGNGGQIKKLNLYDLDNNTKSLEVDILLPFFGLSTDLGHLRNWGLDMAKNHIIVDPKNCMTNIEGIYAIGDSATYEGKLKLILTGFAEAASAFHHAYKRVFDGKALHFEYSTSKFKS